MNTFEQFNDPALQIATIGAVLAPMPIVHEAQMNRGSIKRRDDKGDKSILTETDLASEAAAKQHLGEAHPDVPVLGEETGLSALSGSRRLFTQDPIDGTRPFLVGALTSTIISGLYDLDQKQITAATIGEPSTGRLWHASTEKKTTLLRSDPESGELLPIAPQVCRVWDGEIGDNGTVLIDNFKGFARTDTDGHKRQILTNANVGRLFLGLHTKYAIQNYGSNGMHHALVANGGETMAGSITTSMGGEWDTPGALLVLNAGGSALGLRMNKDRRLTESDPLDPFSYDVLVTANNDDSLRVLRDAVVESTGSRFRNWLDRVRSARSARHG